MTISQGKVLQQVETRSTAGDREGATRLMFGPCGELARSTICLDQSSPTLVCSPPFRPVRHRLTVRSASPEQGVQAFINGGML